MGSGGSKGGSTPQLSDQAPQKTEVRDLSPDLPRKEEKAGRKEVQRDRQRIASDEPVRSPSREEIQAEERRIAREHALELATQRKRELNLLQQSAAKDRDWEQRLEEAAEEEEEDVWENPTGSSRKENWPPARRDEVENIAPPTPDSLDEEDFGRDSRASSGGEYDDPDYRYVITEFSKDREVRNVEAEFIEPNDTGRLVVSGKACPTRLTLAQKERKEEKRILNDLWEEGLVPRPMSRNSSGLSYELVSFRETPEERGPSRLDKLSEPRRLKSHDEIRNKLSQAEERRKIKERERLEKIAVHRAEIKNALDAFACQMKEKDAQQRERDEKAAANREKRLKEMRDKLKAQVEKGNGIRSKQMEIGAIQIPKISKGLTSVNPTARGFKTHQILTEQPVGLAAT